jgi:hypothetical protein
LALVSARVALAGHQHGSAGGALARTVCEGIQDAGYGDVGGENAYQYNRDGGDGYDESNQQRAQVRPTFSLSTGSCSGTRIADPFFRDQSFKPHVPQASVPGPGFGINHCTRVDASCC